MLTPVSLVGDHVRLDPLELGHADALAAVALDPELWAWSPSPVHTRADLDRYLADALAARDAGTALPFATVANGRVVGSTRFGTYSARHRRIEIGWTWIARRWQRTAVNTEAKWLMMRHAFETLGCQRVEWKTDVLNERSRAAIRRLGATEDGVLRSHMDVAGGRRRDTVYYSVVADEWPAVGDRLRTQLER